MEPYDDSNVFARILRNEIPCKKVYEDDHVLAFHDVRPKAPIHVLVIPKGEYATLHDFYERASELELSSFSRAVAKIVHQLNLPANGYRLLANCGLFGGQEVPHFHFHLLAGKPLGPMICS
jgi:histidine triad (HIT) family protein